MNRDDRLYPERPIVGVGAVILVDARCRIQGVPDSPPSPCGVVLVRRRFEPLAGHWSLPGGALEVGETLEQGVAREILEETGLIVSVGDVIEVFDRITFDVAASTRSADRESAGADFGSGVGRARHHYVLIDYLCHATGGELKAGSDVSEVVVADPADLSPYGVTSKIESVVAKALEIK